MFQDGPDDCSYQYKGERQKISVFSSDGANVVIGKDDGIRFVVSGFVGAPDWPETGERISLRRKTNFCTVDVTSNDVQIVVGVLKNVVKKRQ